LTVVPVGAIEPDQQGGRPYPPGVADVVAWQRSVPDGGDRTPGPPFLGTNPVHVAMSHVNDEPPRLPDDVPDPVRDLVATAMAKDPADRVPAFLRTTATKRQGPPTASGEGVQATRQTGRR
jgi:serine/threonine-protein kinase